MTKIWTEYYEKEVAGYLIGLEVMEEGNEFLNKYNIQKFSKSENKDKLTAENKKQLTNDVERLFKVKLLEEKLNELKKLNKYKFILDEVDSVFEHVELLFNDNFEINSGEVVEGSYIGNVVVDYKVVTHYKALVDVEKFKQSGTLKYTSTDSESFKKVGDAMYKNIAKDMFTSKETEQYVNLKWSDIKGTSDESDVYIGSNNQLKKYYNENESFHNSLLKVINDKYFKQQFPSMEIKYDKKSIYETEDFAQQNKDYLVINNLYKNDEDIVALDLAKEESKKKSNYLLTGYKDSINEFLMKDQFNASRWSRIRNNYKFVQDTFLSKDEIYEYQKTKSYYFAIAMGYIDFVGPVIRIGKGKNSYMHKLPDFKLAVSYSMNGVTDENYKTLINFSLKLFSVYKILYQVEDSSAYYSVFKIRFNFKTIWNNNNEPDRDYTNLEINNLLINYNESYKKRMLSSLNQLNIKNNVFKESIYFSVKNIDKTKNNNLVKIGRYSFDSYFWILFKDSLEKPLVNFDSITLNIFGVIKIKFKFDRNLEVKESWTMF